jgi:phosphate-selective porin
MNVNSHKKLLAAMIGAALAGGTLAAQAAEVKLKFGAQADYYRGDAGTLNSDASTANDIAEHEFIVRRARLYFDAKINDLISGSIGLQGDDSSTGVRTSTLKDAYVDLKYHPLAMVRAGMYKYEFDLEGRESSFVRPFMNRSIVTNAVAGNMGLAGTDFRDKGVSLIGASDAFGYGVGLWQGVGADARDNNDKFGYTANVWGKLVGVKVNLGYMNSDNTPPGTLSLLLVLPAPTSTRLPSSAWRTRWVRSCCAPSSTTRSVTE